jgi:DNA invertase Pin-like site-specific DNA recombinase
MQTTTERIITEIPATVIPQERDFRKREARVAAYCRVSTDSEDQLNSYNSQIEYYTTIINENPLWQNAGIFADEGLSGTSTKKRDQFNRMILKCRRGRIDMIIVKSVSRFARNTLDSLGYVRKLKALGVGVIFEKEGVNTLETEDETLLTIFSALAQNESQSLSKNVKMGYRQAFKAGKVPFHIILGYRKGADGQLEIVPEQAEIVQRIYHRYLIGQSIGQICRDLEADSVPTQRGGTKWSEAVIQHVLRNERYAGDVLLQKTYVRDVLTHSIEKNNGVLPQVFIQNNHPAIIDREIWNKTQEEVARRASKRKTPSKTARTSTSKYSGKYALNEIIVCSHCGSAYRRTTWLKPQGRVGVWRCVNRMEHGKNACEKSPTISEEALHKAIMDAVSEVIQRKSLMEAISDSVRTATCIDSEIAEYQNAKMKIADMNRQIDEMLSKVTHTSVDNESIDEEFKKIMDERAITQKVISEFEAKDNIDVYTERQIMEALKALEDEPLRLSEYDDQVIRQIVDTIRVLAKDRIVVTLKGGIEIEQTISNV